MRGRMDVPRPAPSPIKGRVAVVGVCAAGKSTLVAALRAQHYDARDCAQEHSYVPDMWQRLSRPEVLVYLDVSYEALCQRRTVDFDTAYLDEQRRRLAHARRHCAIYIDTSHLSREQVLAKIVARLRVDGITWSPEPGP
jgi:deoxyadenosine/deoxycytidine kinase